MADAAAATRTCSNCRGPNAALKCGVCKKTYYCSGPCQREDWPFHKRNCSKPSTADSSAAAPVPEPPVTPPAATPATPPASDAAASPAPTAAAVPAPAPAPAAETAPASAAPPSGDDDLYDEEDRAAMAAVRKMGYRCATGRQSRVGCCAPKTARRPRAADIFPSRTLRT